MNNFSKSEIRAAKTARDTIISGGVEELKAIYMAGEICMWDEIQQTKVNKCNIPVITDQRELLIAFKEWYNLRGSAPILYAEIDLYINESNEMVTLLKPTYKAKDGTIKPAIKITRLDTKTITYLARKSDVYCG